MTTKTMIVMLLGTCLLLFGCDADTKNVDSCGDGFIDPGEECDINVGDTTCASLGYYSQAGLLTCNIDCTFNLSVCTGGKCGDGMIQTGMGEDCDGAEMAGMECLDLGLGMGTLACKDNCHWNTVGCEFSADCGDGQIQPELNEQCDRENLGGETCYTLGYSQGSGALGCSDDCRFEIGLCQSRSDDANLSYLSVNIGHLVPTFSQDVPHYTLTVPQPTESVTVEALAADPWATLAVFPEQPMTLVVGENQVTVTVTAENGANQEYILTIHRLSDPDASPDLGTLVRVPAGTFQRDATATNLSTVSSFVMSHHEVTRDQWTTVTGWLDPSDATHSSGTSDPVQMVNWYHAIAFCNLLSLLEGLTPVYSVSGVDFNSLTYGEIPLVDDVTWNNAIADWLADGYRLPTEMEWMWAAMGADAEHPGAVNTTGYMKFFAGSTGTNDREDYMVFGWGLYETECGSPEDGRTTTARTNPVGSKLPNELGFLDLSGNVSEWIWDVFVDYPVGSVTDYRGPAALGWGRVIRGGDWDGCSDWCSIDHRGDPVTPSTASITVGFRVVRQ
ncbi:SUMF1/EgtB/PvdO family nonheme iron enzyme [Myxococcota bacterium]|nr:SUMF1/EgtB/PvdO family nonheme iron enzyme [Myxococcota bacterium]